MKAHRIPHVLLPKRIRVAANDDGFGQRWVARLPSPGIPRALVRLPVRTSPVAEDHLRGTALDAMTAIEDLWLRLAAHGVLRLVDHDPDRVTVTIGGSSNSHAETPETRELVAVATRPSTYRWCEDGRTGSWVEYIEQGAETNTALIHLTSRSSILRWPDGDARVGENANGEFGGVLWLVRVLRLVRRAQGERLDVDAT